LQKIAKYIQGKYDKGEPIKLVFICTHNSRRSHFGQIAAALAADFYCIDRVEVYSGGTEATAFHPYAIKALTDLGFLINSEDEKVKNPKWNVYFGVNESTVCFSKTFDDTANPSNSFAAIMTCSDAEQNCPFVPGTELRIGTTYIDPKKSDGTPDQDATYQARFLQIATEMLYVFSLVK
jgi:arsenate reductase (thioredoxin)